MANQSIFAAFERMWQHVTNALSNKANASHTHDYIPNSLKGVANGLAELDSSGKVPSSQLPSYVDDVLEYTSKSSFPTTGESGKIYVDTSTSKTYRWSGSAYVEISASLALGETSSTGYRGDRGKIAYDHSQSAHAPTNAEKNQNAFSNIKVGSTTVAAETTTDTLELVGSNVTITPDATNDKVTIGITKANVTAALGYTPPTNDTNTTYDLAASASSANGNVKLNLTAGGSGSGTDSVTLKGSGATTVTTDSSGVITISSTDNDTEYTHPTSAGNKHIPAGGSSGQILRWSADGTAAWGADNNTTYSQATSSALGLVKIGFPESGKNYPVELNSSGQMYVNVPWTDNNTVYTHPTYTARSSGLYKITVDGTGHVSAATAVTKDDITALGISPSNHTHTTDNLDGGTDTWTFRCGNATTVI